MLSYSLSAIVGGLDEMSNIWKLCLQRSEGIALRTAGAGRTKRRRVQVAVQEQALAALARVAHGDHVVVEQLLLNTEVEVVRPWSLEILHDGEGIKRGLRSLAGPESRALAQTNIIARLRNGIKTSRTRVIGRQTRADSGADVSRLGNGK